MKKVLSVLIAMAVLILSAVPFAVSAEDVDPIPEEETGIQWVFDQGTVIISGEEAIPDYTILNVLERGWWLFYRTEMTDLVIEDGVTGIGDISFWWCDYMKTVSIPETVTRIGNYAFCWCSSLESVEIPDSVTEVGESAFGWCYSLRNIRLSENMTVIPEEMCDLCSSLEEIVIPANVTEIGRSAFRYSRNLSSVTMKAQVPPTLGENAFSDCSDELKIYVPAGSLSAYKLAWPELADRIFAEGTGLMPGDPSGDGEIGITDYLMTKAYVLGMLDITPEQFAAMDIDGDGIVTVTDYLLIKAHVLGIRPIV